MIDFWVFVKYFGGFLMVLGMCLFVYLFGWGMGSDVVLWKIVALFWFGSSTYWQGCWYGGDER